MIAKHDLRVELTKGSIAEGSNSAIAHFKSTLFVCASCPTAGPRFELPFFRDSGSELKPHAPAVSANFMRRGREQFSVGVLAHDCLTLEAN
jgi:hypothetical protein